MIKKLKTWEQFEKETKLYADKWTVSSTGHITIVEDGISWGIATSMKQYFGNVINVEKTNTKDTYKGEGWYWNEKCFEPIFEDFLKEKEMEI